MQLPLFKMEVPAPLHRQQQQKRSRTLERESAARNEWQTPQHIIKHVIDVLGTIDLDPCSNSNTVLNVPAKYHFTANEDSLFRPWPGRVWLNPPYGRSIGLWIQKLVDEYETGSTTSAITLVPARTDSNWWQRLANYPYCAIRGQVKFVRWDDRHRANPSFTCAVVYLGPQLSRFSSVFSSLGTIYIPYTS